MTSRVSDNDALSLEYKLLYGCPSRQADLSDFIGDTPLQKFLSIDESNLPKQFFNVFNRHRGEVDHDV